MHYGEWIPEIEGKNNEDNGKQGIPGDYPTSAVINTYIGGERGDWTRFFTNIARSFNSNVVEFYKRVYFGNYVDVLCSKGSTSNAEHYIHQDRIKYNKELFDFCNNNKINVLMCFSIRAYNALPSSDKSVGIKEELIDVKSICKVRKYIYMPNIDYEGLSLKNKLIVYGIQHPSRGYSHTLVYNNCIRKQKELKWLCDLK